MHKIEEDISSYFMHNLTHSYNMYILKIDLEKYGGPMYDVQSLT